jgi:hypothetical protein
MLTKIVPLIDISRPGEFGFSKQQIIVRRAGISTFFASRCCRLSSGRHCAAPAASASMISSLPGWNGSGAPLLSVEIYLLR